MRTLPIALALAILLPLAACDGAETPPITDSTFEAVVTGSRTLTLGGVARTSTSEHGIPRRTLGLYNPDFDVIGGVSFSRSYQLNLTPGTYEVGPGAGLNGGFSALVTLPGEPSPESPRGVEDYWVFDGTLTITTVTDGQADGRFVLRAGPGAGVEQPEIQVEGSFSAVRHEGE